MAANNQMNPYQKGDTVIMIGLQSKPHWNYKKATIMGPFDKKRQRWPIRINFGNKEGALLKPMNLKKSEQEPRFNVVEIQSNRGMACGPLTNQLQNLSFTQSKLMQYVKRNQMMEYKSPFANLLGYDLSIYVNPRSRDPENNAGSVFLTSALSNGLSPYQQLPGNSIVVCNNKVITSDRIWGILNFILEAMDHYDGSFDMNKNQRQAAIARDVTQYKNGTWEPRAGCGGVNLYNDDPATCTFKKFR